MVVRNSLWFCRRQVNATYSNYSPGYGEIPIDVPADKQAQKVNAVPFAPPISVIVL
jgi:hypothetical protein